MHPQLHIFDTLCEGERMVTTAYSLVYSSGAGSLFFAVGSSL